MARKQTRKSVSISGNTYWALKTKCDEVGFSMSSVVEMLVGDYLGLPKDKNLPRRAATAPTPVAAKPAPVAVAEIPTTEKRIERTLLVKELAEREQSRQAAKSQDTVTDMASQIFTF